MSIAEKKRQKQKKDQRYLLISRAALVGLLLGVFGWLAHSRLPEASLFLAAGVLYSVFVWRVASRSVRAFNVMLGSLLLNFWTLISVDNHHVLAVPAAGAWFVGFLVGGMAGGYVWLGPRAGAQFVPKKRQPGADGNFPGGRRLAVINGVCTTGLLGIGTAQLLLLSPTTLAVTVLVAAFIAGWILFRFPPALQIRNGLVLLGLPAVFITLGFLGGAINQIALPYAWAYGGLAGILIGGRYWSGSRLGAPRPPFNSQHKRRRKRS